MGGQSKKHVVGFVLLAVLAVVAAASYDRERLEIAKQILEEVPLTDGWVKILYGVFEQYLRVCFHQMRIMMTSVTITI